MTVAAWRTRKTLVVRVAALMLYTPGVPFIGIACACETSKTKTSGNGALEVECETL
jgi:hypothetical protein